MRSRVFIYSLLAILLMLAIYFNQNAGSIYAQIGNYYYKQNQIAKAQAFFEKSFVLCDVSYRDVYVNSIINSPLTLEAQEKLVKIAEGSVNDIASTKAKYFLYDLRRELHRTYPLNYIGQAPYNQKIVRWNKLPITYKFVNTGIAPTEYVEEIKNAFNEWERKGSIMFSEVDKNANIVVEFLNNKPDDIDYTQKYVVAYTTPNVHSNTLDNMEIKFYVQMPDGTRFTRNQVYNTALHEIFHALGFMGHSYDSGNIMYLTKDNKTLVDDTRLELTEADISTLKLLYKIKPDITNKGNLKSEYVPYLVLGDDKDVNFSKIKEAKYYINQAPTLPGGYIDLAESLVAQKKYPEAIRALEKALNLADNNDVRYIIYYNLAVSYFYINHLEMSEDYINKAKEIKDEEDLHYLLAEIYTKNDTKKAIKEYEYLISISPDNMDYVIKLINIYVKKYDYINARKVLKNYLRRNPKEKDNARFSPYRMLLW